MDDFDEGSLFTEDNNNRDGANQNMLLPLIKHEINNLRDFNQNGGNSPYVNSKSFSSVARSNNRDGLKFDLKIDLLDDDEDG